MLLDMINQAEQRIFLSSLYIGAEEKELIESLASRLRDRPSLQLNLLLDLNRSTRPGPDSTARILLPLLQEFPSVGHISMFRSPSLRGILAKIVPPRFNEGWGTWHAKIYGSDDSIMISGANLNKSYFTNRQDRYIHFADHKTLAQYCFDYMQTAAKFSYQLLPAHRKRLASSSNTRHSYTHEDYTLHWPDPSTHPHHFNTVAETEFSALQRLYREKATLHPAGQFNVREEESVFRLLFRHLTRAVTSKRPLLDLTSGYFSLYAPYQKLILDAANVDCRIVAAAPKANGFYGSKGISGRIPEGYTLYEQRFMKAVSKAKTSMAWRIARRRRKRSAVERVGKARVDVSCERYVGIWLSPNTTSPPVLTLFGSTNLNERSAHIDTELSFLMVVPSERQTRSADEAHSEDVSPFPAAPQDQQLLSLRQELAREIDGIRSSACFDTTTPHLTSLLTCRHSAPPVGHSTWNWESRCIDHADVMQTAKLESRHLHPDGVSSEWQAFFEKVAAYYERQCAGNRHALISLEKRSWIIEDGKLSEFEMLMSATAMKEKGNSEFKSGNINAAQLHYMSAISTFPTPDAMNNVAACALKLNEFQIAVDFTTKALDIELLTSPSSIAKVHFRRATAHLHLGKFVDALRDATKALSLNPGDTSISVLQERILNTMKDVRPEHLDAYLREQPKPPEKMSFTEGMNWAQTNVQYMRIPEVVLRDMGTKSNPPTY
ncbi:hypothetical protein NLJ89_g1949 [Agrocybe chaxingu]|uniref:CDP-diacylglycerol--glycerol-3-phosphate 3-phosphatidyltransferase n=1 Tax=Agrocybe chaxingu TaxID=84603 RepID=A0A9W8TEA9_9AGAR|nr:hypothetical protein NLJ89_g1949 [Agrocybe chaxingu]